MPLRIRVEHTGQLPTNLAAAFDRAMLQAARDSQQIVVNAARQNARVATGALRRSITADEPEVTGGQIVAAVGAGGSGAPYAKGVEFGTGIFSEADDSTHAPIVIRPIRAKALAWPGAAMGAPGGMYRRLSGSLRTSVRRGLASGRLSAGDVFVFARKVTQMGQPPRPFLRPALEESRGAIVERFRAAIRAVFGGG